LQTATAYDEKYVNQLLANRTVVDNGQSLNGTSIAELKENEEEREHSVRCIMNIENWTAWRLKDALSHNHCGYIHEKFPAPNVDPATREIMVGHKQVSPRKVKSVWQKGKFYYCLHFPICEQQIYLIRKLSLSK
jgi:hypothetical protein